MKSSYVVPYIGTWIETDLLVTKLKSENVVPYIGTWIETHPSLHESSHLSSYLI